jgi:trk system potassium uptake protein
MLEHVIVVGGGRVGAALARLLVATSYEVVVLEQDREKAELLGAGAPEVTVIVGDGSDPATLEAAGARRAAVVAAVSGDDARNLVVCSLARSEFDVPRTIARVVDPSHAWAFGPDLGVDAALDQADLLARLTLDEMSLGEVATLMKLRRGELTLVEERLVEGANAVGRTIGELELPPTVVLLGVLRGETVLPATPEQRLRSGDEVLAVVHSGEAGVLQAALDGDGAGR